MSTGTSNSLRGTGMRKITMPTQNPMQQRLMQIMGEGAMPGIQKGLQHFSNLAGGDPSQFEQMEAPAMRQFSALQGNIASRFSGASSGNPSAPGKVSTLNSSGFQNTMGEAAAGLAERLQGQRMDYQNQATRDLLNMGQNITSQRTFENALMPKDMNFLKQIILALSGGVTNISSMGLLKSLGIF